MIRIQGSQYPSDFEAKKAMTDVGKQMAAKGYGIASDGSLSVRVGPNAVWVTADDAQKGSLTQDMFVKVDLDGKPMLGARGKTLPEEMKIHLKIYREHPEIRAVVHGYPPAAVAMGIRGEGIVSAGFTKTLRKLGDVPVVPYTGGDQDALTVSGCASGHRGVLLQNNGCMTWANSPAEAFSMLEAMEYYGTVMAAAGRRSEAVAAAAVQAVDRTQGYAAGRDSQEDRIPVLNGVTGLVRPRDRADERMGKRPERGGDMPVISGQTSDVIHNTEGAGLQENAAQIVPQTVPQIVPQTVSQTIPQAVKEPQRAAAPAAPKKVTDKPKEDVMAEVVRRTMQNFHL